VKSFLRYWLPVVIWLGVIFFGSTDFMSAEHTSRIIGPFLRWLRPDISPETIGQVQFFVRKAAHVTEYAILALLGWRAIARGVKAEPKRTILYINIWLAATLVASLDEYHQSFVPSRGAAWGDVLIDSGGAIFGLLAGSSWSRRARKKGSTPSLNQR
jgi:VanZ family protein